MCVSVVCDMEELLYAESMWMCMGLLWKCVLKYIGRVSVCYVYEDMWYAYDCVCACKCQSLWEDLWLWMCDNECVCAYVLEYYCVLECVLRVGEKANSWEYVLLLQRTWAWFPAPISGGSQLSVAPAAEGLKRSSELFEYPHPHVLFPHIPIIKNKTNLFKKSIFECRECMTLFVYRSVLASVS